MPTRSATALDGLDLVAVANPAYADGLSTSLQAGLAALPARRRASIVLLGDMPRVTAAPPHGLADAFRAADPAPRPSCRSMAASAANPVLLNRALLAPASPASAATRAPDACSPAATTCSKCAMDAGVTQDVDTPAGLAALG